MSTDQIYSLLIDSKNLLFLFLVALGVVLKNTKQVPDWIIPIALGVVGLVLGLILFGGLPGAMVGFIYATVSVYGHQVVTQWVGRKDLSETPPYTSPTTHGTHDEHDL